MELSPAVMGIIYLTIRAPVWSARSWRQEKTAAPLLLLPSVLPQPVTRRAALG